MARVSHARISSFAIRAARALVQFSLGALFAILICALPARAQTSASIKGIVTDASGARVTGANVTVKNIETGATRTAVTDDEGRFLVLTLMIGEYRSESLEARISGISSRRDSSCRRRRSQR